MVQEFSSVCRETVGLHEIKNKKADHLRSLCPMENEEQLQWLEAQGGWKRVDITGYLPERLRTEVMGQPGTDLERGYCTLLPGKQKCDGFFVALLQKTMER